jgi:cell division protein FtsW
VATTLRNLSKSSNAPLTGTALDRSLLLCVCALMGIGLVLVYSASFIFASETYGDALYFFKRQLIYVFLALLTLGGSSYFPYIYLKKYFWVFFAALVAVLAAVFVPGLGHRVGGATRWVQLPFGFHLEPGELAKLMAPVIFAMLLKCPRWQRLGKDLDHGAFHGAHPCGPFIKAA